MQGFEREGMEGGGGQLRSTRKQEGGPTLDPLLKGLDYILGQGGGGGVSRPHPRKFAYLTTNIQWFQL